MTPAAAEKPAHPRKLRLPGDRPLRRGVVASFADILGYAGEMSVRVREDPGTAVHEVRKSLRRARAFLRMLRPSLSRTAQRSLQTALKEPHRAASPLRDLDVLLAALDRYQLDEVGGEAARALRASLEARHRQRLSPKRVSRVLGGGVESTRPLPARLDRALPEELSWDDLLRGVRKSYRRARREHDRAARFPDTVHVHNWRKRTKDIVYQLELIASAGDSEVGALRKPYSNLASMLGEVTDLIVLRETLREDEELAGRPGLDRLDARVGALLGEKLDRAFDHGAPLFRKKPKKWTKKLEKAAGSAPS